MFGFLSADQIRYGQMAAYSIVYSAPVVVLYLRVSKMFQGGFSMGGAVR